MRVLALAGAIAVVGALTPAARSQAQTCTGNAGFEGGRWRAGVSYASMPSDFVGTDSSQWTGEVAVGSPGAPLFGRGAVARISSGAGAGTTTTASLGAGYQIPIDVGGFCPMLSVEHYGIPDYQVSGFTVGRTANQMGIGAAVGFPVKLSPRVQWRPFAAASYQTVWLRTTLSSAGTSSVSSTHETFGQLEAGVGIVVDLRFTIRPSFVSDFGHHPSQTASQQYVLGASINFGPGSKTE